MTDPKVFTRPWRITCRSIGGSRERAVLEFKCVPFSEELIYGHLRKP